MAYQPTNWTDGGTYGADCFVNMETEIVRLGKETGGSNIFAQKQTENLAKSMMKLRTNTSSVSGDRTEFCFCGDSVFYAFDFINADGKAIQEDCVPDNGSPLTGFTRRPVTPYDTFNDVMNRTYENTIKIKKKIYTGDCAWSAYYRWNASNSDFYILNLGINDAVGSHIDESYHPDMIPNYMGDVTLYIKAIRRLIEREIMNGTAVVFMSITKHTVHREGLDTDSRTLLDVYEQAGLELCKEYNVPVIDGQELVKNFDNTMFIDGIHFTDNGFASLGARMASYFIGQSPATPYRVHGGSYMGITPQLDNVNTVLPTVLENTSYSPNFPISLESDDLYTEVNRHLGGIQASITGGGKIVWSFYCPQDDMIVVPSVYTETEKLGCRMRLDFGVEQGSYSNYWNVVGTTINRENKAISTVEVTNDSFVPHGTGKAYGVHMLNTTSQPVMHIVSKGWHTIEVTPIYPTQTMSIPEENFGDGMLAVFGLNFISFSEYKLITK